MAIQFNNGHTGDYLTYDGSATPITSSGSSPAYAFSMAAWVAVDGSAGTSRFAGGVGTAPASEGVGFEARTTDAWCAYIGGQGRTDYASVSGTSWMYLTYTGTSSASTAYYGTASPLSTVSSSPAFGTSVLDAVRIGCYPALSNWFTGRMAHLRIWSGVQLNKAEFETEMASTTAQRTSDLWAAYEFESGALTTDSSAHGYTLTPTGSAVWVDGPLSGSSIAPLAALITRTVAPFAISY